MHTRLLRPQTWIGVVLILAGAAFGEAADSSAAETPKIENYIAGAALASDPATLSGTGRSRDAEMGRR